MTPSAAKLDLDEELPFEGNFIEQAEYLDPERFSSLATEHPNEEAILKKLMGGGAKLLIGPRGCGKSTLMLKAFHSLLNSDGALVLPIYVNFKLALKIEPLYTKGANAPFWFKKWLALKVFQAAHDVISNKSLSAPEEFPKAKDLSLAIASIEAGATENIDLDQFTSNYLVEQIEKLINQNGCSRCVLLIDDAAHAFSEKQQEDFFDFFRGVKSRTISPKAAVYPGITSHSPSFHVGHDAEQVDAWVRPSGKPYEDFMLEMARKRFLGTPIEGIYKNTDDLCFLAYASFGIPRAFLGMLRSIYNAQDSYINSDGSLSKSRLLSLARQGREMSHAVYSSLNDKLPPYRKFTQNGASIYQAILDSVKEFNRGKEPNRQAIQFGVQSPTAPDVEKVFQFLQYSGLIMPAGEVMRGVKGTFSIYDLHIGDLITENAIVGKRTKSIAEFLEVIRATRHQAWPRLTSASVCEAAGVASNSFSLSLPQCQACGTERLNSSARFCSNCGAQLKSSSTYEALVQQDISALPISSRLQKRIKEHSRIRKVKDILIDSNREQLRGIKYIGETRARYIVGAAEEYVS
ncbi:hypothetical protein [Rhizobium leguminosarum]|uniref:hypothetical protein n=1 Tax=Rhizobium leguminosarum TaxID=384 RepID=UPI00103B525D|nr:hypothetical protein [Rhizobium leguminosarum]TBZ27489.1 hypothetical protein E0H44_38095 [Rhizobium leguminosarum bv. viciae]